jgi:hypothetical protein
LSCVLSARKSPSSEAITLPAALRLICGHCSLWLAVKEHRAGHVLAAPRSLVAKHIETVELRVVDATLLAVDANTLLVIHQLQNLRAHLVTAMARFM